MRADAIDPAIVQRPGRGEATAPWPELPWRDWGPTMDTLHLWLQIVGKVRMALAPPLNHWWHVSLFASARGLTTTTTDPVSASRYLLRLLERDPYDEGAHLALVSALSAARSHGEGRR